MSIPTTYFEWCQFLELFAQGEDSILINLEKGSFIVDSGTVYRFYNKVQETYVERKKKWLDKFNRSFQIQSIKTENDITIVLRNAKTYLQPIARLINLPAIPKDLQETLRKDFNDFIADIRKNLKESIYKNQPANVKILFIINTFNFFESVNNNFDSETFSPDSETEATQNKRRILF